MTKEEIKETEKNSQKELEQELQKIVMYQKSRAKKIKNLFKEYKTWYGIRKRSTISFKQPGALLMRKNGTIELLEDASAGEYNFISSSGHKRKIWLNPKLIHKMQYGPESISLYVLHEDHPTPLPTDPFLTIEQQYNAYEKVAYDVTDLKIKEEKTKHGRIETWGLVIIGIIIALAMAWMVIGDSIMAAKTPPPQAVEQVVNATGTAIGMIWVNKTR